MRRLFRNARCRFHPTVTVSPAWRLPPRKGKTSWLRGFGILRSATKKPHTHTHTHINPRGCALAVCAVSRCVVFLVTVAVKSLDGSIGVLVRHPDGSNIILAAVCLGCCLTMLPLLTMMLVMEDKHGTKLSALPEFEATWPVFRGACGICNSAISLSHLCCAVVLWVLLHISISISSRKSLAVILAFRSLASHSCLYDRVVPNGVDVLRRARKTFRSGSVCPSVSEAWCPLI